MEICDYISMMLGCTFDSYVDTNLDKRLSLIDTCYLTTKFLKLF